MLLEAFINRGGGGGIRETPVALYTVLSRGFTAFYYWTEQTPLLDTQSELFHWLSGGFSVQQFESFGVNNSWFTG